jgi:hypothetical protein
MNDATYEGTVLNGQICLPPGVSLPESRRVLVVVPSDAESQAEIVVTSTRIHTPHLVNREQAADFRMEVGEVDDAEI